MFMLSRKPSNESRPLEVAIVQTIPFSFNLFNVSIILGNNNGGIVFLVSSKISRYFFIHKSIISSDNSGGFKLGNVNSYLEIYTNTRPAVVVGEDTDSLALMSDLTSYTWNEVTTAKATRLADLPESYPVGTLTVKHSEGEVSYDGSEDVSIDLTHIQQSINTLKDTMEYLLSTKQDKLVSGVNIKKINGKSVLGNGDILISSDSTAIRYKGSVATRMYLPSAPEVGDIYNVINDGANYAWNGETWETYGTITPTGVDLYKNASGEITGGEVRFSDNTVLPINIFIK